METFLLFLAISLISFALYFVGRDDVLFLRHGAKHTVGTVIGHRISTDDGSTFYMAQYALLDENGGKIEVTDTYGAGRAMPTVGTTVKLIYPTGYADRARPPRHILRAVIYLFLVSMFAVLFAKLFGLAGS